ncbi:MAG: HEPN domain-containing protein [Bacteroidota bacterium]
MISKSDLLINAGERLQDAEVLLQNKRFDGAVYLSGYAIELALKARICRTLRWSDFPESRNEFQSYQSFKTHNLDVLLHLSGVENSIRKRFPAHWQVVAAWNPELRYKPLGTATRNDVENMIKSTKVILRALQ